VILWLDCVCGSFVRLDGISPTLFAVLINNIGTPTPPPPLLALKNDATSLVSSSSNNGSVPSSHVMYPHILLLLKISDMVWIIVLDVANMSRFASGRYFQCKVLRASRFQFGIGKRGEFQALQYIARNSETCVCRPRTT
jgi:hypothetical protein